MSGNICAGAGSCMTAVRKTLGDLCLAHVMVNVAKGSANRDMLEKRLGRFEVPYLEDPNTGTKLVGKGACQAYLKKNYTL